jgi:hypothetical protein
MMGLPGNSTIVSLWLWTFNETVKYLGIFLLLYSSSSSTGCKKAEIEVK